MDEDKKKLQEEREFERIAKVQSFFSGLVKGESVVVYRSLPKWCASYLETIEISDGDQIDIDYLIARWGGHELKLRMKDEHGQWVKDGSATIKLKSYKPRRNGEILKQEWGFEELQEELKSTLPQREQPKPKEEDLGKILESMQKMMSDERKANTQLFNQMMALQIQQNQPQQQSSNGLEDVIQNIEKIKNLRDLLAPEVKAMEGDTNAQFLGSVVEIAKAFKPDPKPTPVPEHRPNITAPPSTEAQSTAAFSGLPDPETITDLASKMDPEDFANLFLKSLVKMPEDNRAETIEYIAKPMGLTYNDSDDMDWDADEVQGDLDPDETEELNTDDSDSDITNDES